MLLGGVLQDACWIDLIIDLWSNTNPYWFAMSHWSRGYIRRTIPVWSCEQMVTDSHIRPTALALIMRTTSVLCQEWAKILSGKFLFYPVCVRDVLRTFVLGQCDA
jgi:hypothetical protein